MAFSCKGRGFCPSCLGRKMAATAAHLVDDVLPVGIPLRQWVLTVPFSWRKRLGYDGPLLSALTRLFVKTVLEFYGARGVASGRGQSGAVVAVQRTSADLKLNPHVHAVFLDGVFRNEEEVGDELEFHALSHLTTRDVAAVLERTRDRMTKYLRRRGLLDAGDVDGAEEEEDASEGAGLTRLAASAVSGATPPAGPEWRRGALPLRHRAMVFERPLCVALDGFTLHAATRAGGLDEAGREPLLEYILRPAVAQERVTRRPDGLVRIALKGAFSDGTVAVDLDPLSLLSRLCASVPPPRFHTVRYAGVLGSASKLRSRPAPKRAAEAAVAPCVEDVADMPRRRPYRPSAELLKRTFGFDVLACPRCDGRMRLLAMVTEPRSVARYLRALGEPTEAPAREAARGPPFWKSRVLRRAASDDHAADQRAPARLGEGRGPSSSRQSANGNPRAPSACARTRPVRRAATAAWRRPPAPTALKIELLLPTLTTRRFGGTGLGLAIVRDLLEAMSGTVRIEETRGGGSTFVVELDLAACEVAEPAPVAPPTANDGAVASLASLHVLLAEDEPVNRMLVTRLLKRLGCSVQAVGTGTAVVEAVGAQAFDVILMDIEMPELDGYGATAEVRRIEKASGRRTPIIALTAHVLPEVRARCVAADMDDYLAKPIGVPELVAALGKWCPARAAAA